MNFELLPNEIVLEVFNYLPITHLFRAFFGLNSRFNNLLCIQFRNFSLDFRLTSKTDFNHVYKHYLPLIINQIKSLYLSNDDDTPDQIELLLSSDFQLRQFTHLQSISLSYIRSQDTLNKIMIECSYLPSLAHLTFTDAYIPMNPSDATRFFDYVWSLPHLTHCNFGISFDYENYFPDPTSISTSIKHLAIRHTSCCLSQLTHLCQHTPHLQCLLIHFENDPNEFELSLSILSITRLKIVFDSSISVLERLLQNMPDLYHLTFEIHHMCIDGYRWEEMIRKYLPTLKIFRYKMRCSPDDTESKEVKFNQIINSFRTKFWIDEHQWFVGCQWVQSDEQIQRDFIDVFTLPYTFDVFFTYKNCLLVKSTCPYDGEYWICDRVINLFYGWTHITDSIVSPIRFTNIKHLSLSFPYNDQFLSVVSKLDRLISLYVFVDRTANLDNIQSQLQFVLDRAPRLQSLSYGVWSPSMEITSLSVRRLNFQGYGYDLEWRCFDDEECTQLISSPLGIQCETLLIEVKSGMSILNLVNQMNSLQALNVRCKEDNWTDENDLVSTKEDEFIKWLREHLPSTCTIERDKYIALDIRLWIR